MYFGLLIQWRDPEPDAFLLRRTIETIESAICLHSKHAKIRLFNFATKWSGQTQSEYLSRLCWVDYAIVPQSRRTVVAVRLAVKLLDDLALQFLFFLRRERLLVLRNRRQHVGRWTRRKFEINLIKRGLFDYREHIQLQKLLEFATYLAHHPSPRSLRLAIDTDGNYNDYYHENSLKKLTWIIRIS